VSVLSTYFPLHLQGTPSVVLSFQLGCRDGAPEGVLKLGYNNTLKISSSTPGRDHFCESQIHDSLREYFLITGPHYY